MKRILSYLVVTAAALLCAGTLSAQISKTSAPIRYGWVSYDDMSEEFGLFGEHPQFQVEYNPLYGNVESVEEFIYYSGDLDESGYPRSDAQYDARRVWLLNDRGDVVEYKFYDGSYLDLHNEYEYNDLGLISREILRGSVYGDLICLYEYNSKRQLVKKTEMSPLPDGGSEVYQVYNYKYDAKGNLISMIRTSDTVKFETTYTYDSANRLINISEFDCNENMCDNRTDYSYDAKGCIDGYTVIAGERNVARDVYFVYDARGNLDKINYCFPSRFEVDHTTQLVYNSSCKFCGYDHSSGGLKKIYTFDAKGRVIELHEVANDAVRARFEHDDKGNVLLIRYNAMYIDYKDFIETRVRKINYRK